MQRPQILIDSYEEAISRSLAAKIVILTNDADALIAAAREHFTENEFSLVRGSPEPFFVEFLRPDVCKGTGLKLICEHLGIDACNVAAFGDGDNDKEMLKYAGVGVAMNNAKDAAKEAANVVLEVIERVYLLCDIAIPYSCKAFMCICLTAIFTSLFVQWTNDEDGVARQLERMQVQGLFANLPIT